MSNTMQWLARLIIYEKIYTCFSSAPHSIRSHQHHPYFRDHSELKLQNLQIVDQKSGTKFFHPFMQSVCMFIGETLVGLVYLVQWLKSRHQSHEIDSK